jgi:hypothetical protein
MAACAIGRKIVTGAADKGAFTVKFRTLFVQPELPHGMLPGIKRVAVMTGPRL